MGGGTGAHFCTATVIASKRRNLLVTAAHCMFHDEVGPPRKDVAFVPGYRDGRRPHGTWPVAEVVVSSEWQEHHDPDHDVAVLVLNQQAGREIQDAVGAHPLVLHAPRSRLVDVPGYPNAVEHPITCRNWTTQFSATQRGFDCRGYLDGTSGAPWLTESGEVIGVVGGFQYGGDVILHNYSPYFAEQARTLYQRATEPGPQPRHGR